MKRDSLNWWLTLLANIGVLGGLVFVGLEIRQNTRQLRAEAAHSVTSSVNEINAGIYADEELAEIVKRGERDLAALNEIERFRFDLYQFSRLNVGEYMKELEEEGVSGLNFRFHELLVREFTTLPGLRDFIREYESLYVGSVEYLDELLGQ